MDSFWVGDLQFDCFRDTTTASGEHIIDYRCTTVPGFHLQHYATRGVWCPAMGIGNGRHIKVGAREGYASFMDAAEAWQAVDQQRIQEQQQQHNQQRRTRGPQQRVRQPAWNGGRQQPAAPAQQHQYYHHHYYHYHHHQAQGYPMYPGHPSFGFPPAPYSAQTPYGPTSNGMQQPAYGSIDDAAMGQQAYQGPWMQQHQQHDPYHCQHTSSAGARQFASAGQAQALSSSSMDTHEEGTAAQEVPPVVQPSTNAVLQNLRMRLQACTAQQGNAAAAGQGSSPQQVQLDKPQAELAAQATSSGGSSSGGQPNLAGAPSMPLAAAAADKEPAGAGPGLWCSDDIVGIPAQHEDQELYGNSSCLQASAGISNMAAGGAATSTPASLAGSSAMSDDLAMNGPWDGLASRSAAATNPSRLSDSGGLGAAPTVGTSQPPTIISVEPSQGIQSAAAAAGPVEEEDLEPPINLPPLSSSFAASPGTAAGDDLAIAAQPADRVTSSARLSSSSGLGAAPPVGTSLLPTNISVEPSQGIQSAAAAAEPVQGEDEALLPTVDLSTLWAGFGAAAHSSGLNSPAASPGSTFQTPPPAAFAACFSGAVGPAVDQELTCSVVQMASPCLSHSVSVLEPHHVHRYDNTTPISNFGATPSQPRSTPLQDADMDDLLPGEDTPDEGCPGWLQHANIGCSLINMGASLAALQQSTP